jgi:hypothetical protein
MITSSMTFLGGSISGPTSAVPRGGLSVAHRRGVCYYITTMGGRTQPQVHTHLALNLALGMTPAAAVARPGRIVGWMEAGAASADDATTIAIEQGVSPEAIRELLDAGFQTKQLESLDDAAGHLQIVRRAEGPVAFTADSDPRSDGQPGEGD